MSKGGGSAPSSTVTTQVEKLPVELVPFYKDLLGRGVYESLTGYETYPERRLAEFDPYEAGAQEAYAEMALEGTPQALADAQEAAGGPVTVESGDDLVMTFGSFANKSAVWNHEFRHRGLRILRQEYSDDEIMERVPLSFMERLRDFAGRSINKTKVMEGLLDSMSKPDGQEWLMSAYDDFDNVGSGAIDESKLLTPDQVTEFMDALNSLANDHLERIQKEKYETNLRKRGLDSEPVFNPTNRAGSGGISSTFVDTEESMLQ